MSRTTLNLDPLVIRELRQRSKQERKSMGDLASQLLARALRADESPSPPPTFDWVSRDLGTPTVDLEDKEALYSRLEQDG